MGEDAKMTERQCFAGLDHAQRALPVTRVLRTLPVGRLQVPAHGADAATAHSPDTRGLEPVAHVTKLGSE